MIVRLTRILRETGCLHLLPAFKAEGVDDGLLSKLTDRDLLLLGVDRLGDRMRLLRAFEWKGLNENGARSLKEAPPNRFSAGAQSPHTPTPSPQPSTVPIPTATVTAAAPSIRAEDRAGAEFVSELPGGVCMEFRKCPAGEFVMGSSPDEFGRGEDEGPVTVQIRKSFWLGRTAVTQAQWKAVMRTSPSHMAGPRRPVENVTWEDAARFVEAASSMLRLPPNCKLALPTEAQWEYACRAGTTTPFSFGTALTTRQANFNGNYPYGFSEPGDFLEAHAECGTYPPNPWGLCEMHGNIWEWCADWYGATLMGGEDPAGPAFGPGRVYRGGSWHSVAEHCRSAFRYYLPQGSHHMFLGFRVALVASN